MKAPTIGELHARVSFQQPIIEADATGGQYVTWQPYRTLWGMIKNSRGGEEQQGESQRPKMQLQIIIRMRYDITPMMRCFIDEVIYNIVSIYPLDSDKRWLVCDLQRKEGI
jgi:SPP1 family predicted phage head-tail adaptor